jgi:hypothetical protein
MKMKIIVLVIVSWFFQLVVVGENTYNGGRGIGNTNKGETPTTAVVFWLTPTTAEILWFFKRRICKNSLLFE